MDPAGDVSAPGRTPCSGHRLARSRPLGPFSTLTTSLQQRRKHAVCAEKRMTKVQKLPPRVRPPREARASLLARDRAASDAVSGFSRSEAPYRADELAGGGELVHYLAGAGF